uniref:Uncharacterized protein n=1 Tax=Rhizophora mucronata TaxID=61149 RepID=A0A2P2J3Q9_RHIMU
MLGHLQNPNKNRDITPHSQTRSHHIVIIVNQKGAWLRGNDAAWFQPKLINFF